MSTCRPSGYFRISQLCLGLLWLVPCSLPSQAAARRPLSSSDIDAIAQLTMLEDRRSFDSAVLGSLLQDPHPEVRRRTAQSIGRINDKRGVALLLAHRLDSDTAVTATIVWSLGQLKDTATVGWLDSVLSNTRGGSSVRAEAATALGKVNGTHAGEVLQRFLSLPATGNERPNVVGQALLSLGRIVPRPDLSVVNRWVEAKDEVLRWGATWALARTKDPAGVTMLITLAGDPSPLIRSWAVRGLTRGAVDSAKRALGNESTPIRPRPALIAGGVTAAMTDSAGLGARAMRLLIASASDPDRRVATEALKAIASYADSTAYRVLFAALGSPDAWLSVSAAEGLATLRTPASSAALYGATTPTHPCSVRVVALQALGGLSADSVADAAIRVAADTIPYCRNAALTILTRQPAAAVNGSSVHRALDILARDRVATIRLSAMQSLWTTRDLGLENGKRREIRQTDLSSSDPVVRAAALRSMSPWADSVDVPLLLDAYARGLMDSSTTAAAAAASVLGSPAARARMGDAVARFLARFGAPGDPALRRDVERSLGATARTAWAATSAPQHSPGEYRALVERWIVPEYQGKPRPIARWETGRGTIEMEIFAGDAPLATQELLRLTESGALVGTQFTRVVADFVDQQETIRGSVTQREELNRRGLTRANLAWATAGLDTGSPGYTLGHTPQPHNEGSFTSLGRVIRGMDVADHIQLGDRITGARLLVSGGRP